MNCKECQTYFYRYMDDELKDESLKADIVAHLQSCPICSLEYGKEDKLNKLIKEHLIQEPAPYELREAVIQRIESIGSFKRLFNFSHFKWVPSLSALSVVIILGVFAIGTTLSRPFPVFAESVDRHLEHLQGGYPMEIKSSDIDDVLHWFEGKLDFAVARPHLDHHKVKLIGARICHLKDQKVAYFLYEKEGRAISAFVMNYDDLKTPRLRKTQVHDHEYSTIYVKNEKGYESVLCFHKKIKTGCILVSDMPKDELMQLMG